MNKAHKEILKKNFENAVNAYVAAFLELFEISSVDCWWVRDKVGVDNFCFGDCNAISLEDMIFCVDNDVTYDEYYEHTEYCCKCIEYNIPIMSLESWHNGAPRHSFEKLDALKKDLYEAIEQEKSKY